MLGGVFPSGTQRWKGEVELMLAMVSACSVSRVQVATTWSMVWPTVIPETGPVGVLTGGRSLIELAISR